MTTRRLIPRHTWLGNALVTAALLSAIWLAVGETQAQPPRVQKAEIRLAADRTAYEPGDEVRIAALMTIEEGWHTNSHQPTYDWLIPTEVTLTLPEGWPQPTLEYPTGKMMSFEFTEEPISVYDGLVRVVGTFTVPEDASPAVAPVVRGSLRYQACDDHSCLPPVATTAELALTLGSGGEPAHRELFAADFPGLPGETGEAAAPEPRAAGLGLPAVLLLAALGGLILNAMPCVLPVLSLKVFGLIQSAGRGRSHVVTGGLATSVGILVSFWALAAAAAAARAAGAAVGWGTQFQHPGFVTFLAVVVVLFCLNLWGLFEIPLPGRLARAASGGPNEGVAGHFASGLFATLMATPCSAPFLGTALGFALTQPAPVVFLTFTAIGLGMSVPYLLLAAAPGTVRIFPKPGPWMEHLRKVMGFLLAAAAVWLFYVLSGQVSAERLALLELGLLVLALFVWARSRMAVGPALRRVALAGALAAAVGTVVLAAQPGDGPAAAAAHQGGGRIEWTEFDRADALALAEAGSPVFVDVTADWCLTCKANERLVLETEEVAEAFTRHGVVAMKADWTNRDETIGAFLAEFGKAGIPFYVLYVPGGEPRVFGELLSKEAVLSAVREADVAGVAGLTPGD